MSFFVFHKKKEKKQRRKNEFRLKNHSKMTFMWFDQGWLKKKFFIGRGPSLFSVSFLMKKKATTKKKGPHSQRKRNSSHGGLV